MLSKRQKWFTSYSTAGLVNVSRTQVKRKQQSYRAQRLGKKKHSQQFRPQDHGHFFTGVVATETQTEKMVGAGLPGAEHAAGGPDRWQVEVFGLAGTHPDLVPQSVVYHGVALLTDKTESGRKD